MINLQRITVVLLCSVFTQSVLQPIKGITKVGRLQLSPIGIGTWAWGNQFLWGYRREDDEALGSAYDYLVSKGVSWFDTADSYGTGSLSGRSEKLLGQFSAANKKGQVNLCTKIAPFPWIIGDEAVEKKIYASCERLQRPIDLLQLHWPPTLRWQEDSYLKAFTNSIKSNNAKQIGLSNCGPKTLPRLRNAIIERGCNIYSNQVQFSLLSQDPLKNGLTKVCSELEVQPIAYSPLALGLLTDKYSLQRLPNGPRAFLFKEYLPKIQNLIDELRSVSKYRGKTVAQVALNWVLQKGFLLIVGVKSIEQARENLGALSWSLTAAEVQSLDAASLTIKRGLIQNINQSA